MTILYSGTMTVQVPLYEQIKTVTNDRYVVTGPMEVFIRGQKQITPLEVILPIANTNIARYPE